jgi:hypothetical protein
MSTRVFALLWICILAAGCTIRYSKGLDDRVESATDEETVVVSRRFYLDSSGFEIFFVQLVDTENPAALLKTLGEINGCKRLKNAEVDYRNISMFFFNLPTVVVSADCESGALVQRAPRREVPTAQVPKAPPVIIPEPKPEVQAPAPIPLPPGQETPGKIPGQP